MRSVITYMTAKGHCTTYRPTAKAKAEIDGLHAKHAPGHATHDELVQIMIELPTDFEPYGKRNREGEKWQDCSCGCNFYHALQGEVSSDWGVCTNPKSPRVGLLTFEHQGCPEWTDDPRWDAIDREERKILRRDKREQKKNGKMNDAG